MSWDAWALLAILTLCLGVIAWSCWGFYRDAHPADRVLRLSLKGGGFLSMPRRAGASAGRHRARSRHMYWPTVHLTNY